MAYLSSDILGDLLHCCGQKKLKLEQTWNLGSGICEDDSLMHLFYVENVNWKDKKIMGMMTGKTWCPYVCCFFYLPKKNKKSWIVVETSKMTNTDFNSGWLKIKQTLKINEFDMKNCSFTHAKFFRKCKYMEKCTQKRQNLIACAQWQNVNHSFKLRTENRNGHFKKKSWIQIANKVTKSWMGRCPEWSELCVCVCAYNKDLK